MSSPSASIAGSPSGTGLPSAVVDVLSGLKRRIRLYVVVEGAALVLVLLAVLFWVSLGLDWAWFQVSRMELPVWFRAIFDVLVVCSASVVAVSWIVFRFARSYRSRGLALVLERRFPELDDRLITAIEMADDGDTELTELGRAMLEKTRRDVIEASRRLEVGDVFQKKPLRRAVLMAVGLLVSIGGLAVADSAVITRWADGFLSLKETYWPREYQLVVTVVRGPSQSDVPIEPGTPYRHPRGDDLVLSIEVKPDPSLPGLAPLASVEVRYGTAGGSGRGVCSQRGPHQFRFTRAGVLEDLSFRVAGGDFINRRPYLVQVVESPTLEQIVLDCRYPDYTGLNPPGDSSQRTRQTVQGIQVDLPLETDVLLQARTNKPFVGARIEFDNFLLVLDEKNGVPEAWFEREAEDGQAVRRLAIDVHQLLQIDSDGSVRWPSRVLKLPLLVGTGSRASLDELFAGSGTGSGPQLSGPIPLPADVQIRIAILDTDDIQSRDPSRLTINGIVDQPPEIETSLRGIGSEVTRIARIPIIGLVRDDYGVDEVHFEYQVVGRETRADQLGSDWLKRSLSRKPTDRPREFILTTARDDIPRADALKQPRHEQAVWFDLRQLDPEPTIGQKLVLSVVATDADDKNGPHSTRSNPVHVFTIVSNEDLQFGLIQKELRFRQRFEQVIDDIDRTRKNLLGYRRQVEEATSATGGDGVGGGDEGGEQVNPAERSINEVIRGHNETVAIAEGFADIRDELINNGVHTQQTLTRIDQGVLMPLQRITSEDYTLAETTLRVLARASRGGTRPSLETIDTATDSLGDLLERMRRVLAEMRKLETYQEALKLLKQIIDDEEKLLEKTREQRKRDLIKKLNGAGLGDDSQPDTDSQPGKKAVPEVDKVKR